MAAVMYSYKNAYLLWCYKNISLKLQVPFNDLTTYEKVQKKSLCNNTYETMVKYLIHL